MLKLATIVLAIVTFCSAQDASEGLETTVSPLGENETVTLDLSNQNITSLKDYNFTNYAQLEHLDLSNNDIKFVHEETFDKNKKLKTLNLSGNKNLVLPKFSLFINAELETLNVSNCNLQTIAQNSFDGLLNLRTLDISNNPIAANGINVFALSTTTNLRRLIAPHLDNSTLMEICTEVDITIEMRYADTNNSVTCEEVRAGTWVEPLKEAESPQVEETTEENNQTETPSLDSTTVMVVRILNFSLDAIDPRDEKNNSSVKEIETVVVANETATVKPQTEEEKQTNATGERVVEKNPMHRNIDISTINDSSLNASAKSSNELVKASQSTKGGDTGTNVLIFLVVAVVVCGIGAFIYKYYKSKQLQEAEPIEKELQEITINTHIKPDDTIEEEPLMNQRKNSVEIREIDETPIQQNGKEAGPKNTPYVPITSVERTN